MLRAFVSFDAGRLRPTPLRRSFKMVAWPRNRASVLRKVWDFDDFFSANWANLQCKIILRASFWERHQHVAFFSECSQSFCDRQVSSAEGTQIDAVSPPTRGCLTVKISVLWVGDFIFIIHILLAGTQLHGAAWNVCGPLSASWWHFGRWGSINANFDRNLFTTLIMLHFIFVWRWDLAKR